MSGDELAMDLEDLLNPDEQRRYRRLCLPTDPEELAQLAEVVDLHMDHIRNYNPQADVETAEQIAIALVDLISNGGSFGADKRSLIRGAVEYFLLADDATGDLDDQLGFDDDARVVNAMLRRIDRSDLELKLG